MVDVVSIASYISERYMKEYGERIDEMKLHKLLYLTQRECLIQTGEPMFEATFHAWKYGPVLPEIRQLYKQDSLKGGLTEEQEEKYKQVLEYVFAEYAHKRSFVLSLITHGNYSWKHAREGYGKYEDSDVPMLMKDIRRDAAYFKQRRLMLKIELAEKIPCELLLTFNTADYPLDKESSVKVLSPEEYLDACSKLY